MTPHLMHFIMVILSMMIVLTNRNMDTRRHQKRTFQERPGSTLNSLKSIKSGHVELLATAGFWGRMNRQGINALLQVLQQACGRQLLK